MFSLLDGTISSGNLILILSDIGDGLNHFTCPVPLDTLIFASKVKKINHFGMNQERTIAITDKAIYNIHKGKIKRSIMMNDCTALTKTVEPSKCKTEFTLHVQRTYDYRFISDE